MAIVLKRILLLWISLALAVLPLSGCQTTPRAPQTPVLAAVILGPDRLAQPDEWAAVQVTRGGVPVAVQPGLALQPGDVLQTGARAYAVVRWPNGTEVYIAPDSRGTIGSVRDFVGQMYIKARGFFMAATTVVATRTDGTQWWLRALPGGAVTVTVFENRIRVSSLTNAWPEVPMSAGQTATMVPRAPVPRAATAQELQRVRDWVEAVERLTPPAPARASAEPSWVPAAVMVGIGVLIGTMLNRKDKERPPPPNQDPPTGRTGRTIQTDQTPSVQTPAPPVPRAPASSPAPSGSKLN